jgi:hypothetical protein
MRNEKIGFQKGHPGYKNKTSFKPKHKPWNKGVLGKKDWHNTTGLVTDGSLNRGKKMSDEQKEKLSLIHAGKKLLRNRGKRHWNWKGGRTPLRKNVMQTYLYKEWRKNVFSRDDYTCQHCGVRGLFLHADHIKPYSQVITENKITTVDEAKRCAELWDISNGRTLCVACHRKTVTYGAAQIDLPKL